MSEVARLYRYKSLLVNRRAVSAATLMAELEISPATFKRDLAKLRDQMHVPITFDRELRGYRLEQGHTDSELPGLWFSPEEVIKPLHPPGSGHATHTDQCQRASRPAR